MKDRWKENMREQIDDNKGHRSFYEEQRGSSIFEQKEDRFSPYEQGRQQELANNEFNKRNNSNGETGYNNYNSQMVSEQEYDLIDYDANTKPWLNENVELSDSDMKYSIQKTTKEHSRNLESEQGNRRFSRESRNEENEAKSRSWTRNERRHATDYSQTRSNAFQNFNFQVTDKRDKNSENKADYARKSPDNSQDADYFRSISLENKSIQDEIRKIEDEIHEIDMFISSLQNK